MVLQATINRDALYWRIKELLKTDQLSEALYLVRRFAEQRRLEDLKKEAIKMDRRVVDLEHQTKTGLIFSDYANNQRNHIVRRILEIIDNHYEMMNNYFINNSPIPSFWRKLKNLFE